MSDVDTTTPSQGEALVWDGTKWVNGTVSTVGNLDDLSDVDTTGKQEGDSLRYIGNEWKAKPTTVEMTQAEYNAIVDFTPYANTHIVITDAPNLNPTANDIEYSSGVSVADKLTSLDTGKAKKTWTTLGTLTESGTALDISGYTELLIYPKINGTTYFNTYVVDVAEFSNTNVIHFSIYQDSTHSYMGALDYSSNTINLRKVLIAGWTNCVCIVKAR